MADHEKAMRYLRLDLALIGAAWVTLLANILFGPKLELTILAAALTMLGALHPQRAFLAPELSSRVLRMIYTFAIAVLAIVFATAGPVAQMAVLVVPTFAAARDYLRMGR